VKQRFLLFSLALMIAVLAFWFVNRDYINTFASVASEGITATNYKKLPGLIKTLPQTKQILSYFDHRKLEGNSRIERITVSGKKIHLHMNFREQTDDIEKRSAVLTWNFEPAVNLTDEIIFGSFDIGGNVIGQGHQASRMQLEMTDIKGKRINGPKIPVERETYLILRPTSGEPIPLGSSQWDFDLTRVRSLSIRFVVGGVVPLPAWGRVSFDGLYSFRTDGLVSKLFDGPNYERVTKDNINIAYSLRKLLAEEESDEFFVGLNYPWNNYGWDVGKNPYGQPENAGWSANEDKLLADLRLFKENGIKVVRIYIFFDLRTGLEYENGKLVGFDRYVRKDIETIFRAAGTVGIKIIPVLFDFSIADGRGKELGGADHPELIFSSDKFGFLADLMRPILRDMDKWNRMYGKPVFAVELMNEPENMAILLIPGYFHALKLFFTDLANIVHQETSFAVTLGSHSIVDMQRWWDEVAIDIWQFHFYKYMRLEHEQTPQELDRNALKQPGIVFCGELQPADITENLDALKRRGYNGVLFWSWNSDDGFKISGNSRSDEIFAWIESTKKTP
jgi:hypothetical protein